MRSKLSMSYTPLFLYYLLFKPKESIEHLVKSKEDEHIGIALSTAALAFVFELIGKAIAVNSPSMLTFFIEINIIPYIIGFFGNILLFVAIWYFTKILTLGNSKTKSVKTKNDAYILFKIVCFTYFPLIFAPAIGVISLFLSNRVTGSIYTTNSIYFLFKIFLIGWIAYLQIIALKILFELKTITAFLLYILPVLAFFALIILKIWSFLSFVTVNLI